MSKSVEFVEFMNKVIESEYFEICENHEWVKYHISFFDIKLNSFTPSNYFYNQIRLKPKEEEKKKIPLGLIDITPSTVFSRSEGTMFNWSFANHSMILIYDLIENKFMPNDYINLIGQFNYSTDNGKTWKGCFKYED